MAKLEDVVPVVNDIYQYAVDRWPIPEALGYAVYDQGVPTALAAISAASLGQSERWPGKFDQLAGYSRHAFFYMTVLLEATDELYPSAVSHVSGKGLEALCRVAKSYRETFKLLNGPDQFKFSFGDRTFISTDGIEWRHEDIASSMRRIYAAGVRGSGGGASGRDLLRLVQAFKVPELWHEVVVNGRRPDGPFEILSWIANQRECDAGTALKIMHLVAYDAAGDASGRSQEAQLAEKILRNLKKGFYRYSRFAANFGLARGIENFTVEEFIKFHISKKQERVRFEGRDLPLHDDGFGIILGVTENPYAVTPKRRAVNAFAQSWSEGLLQRTTRYLRGKPHWQP